MILQIRHVLQPERRGELSCQCVLRVPLRLDVQVESPPVCRCLSVPASCRSILLGESPSSSSRRECGAPGAGVRPPPSESALSLRIELPVTLPVPLSVQVAGRLRRSAAPPPRPPAVGRRCNTGSPQVAAGGLRLELRCAAASVCPSLPDLPAG